LKMLPAHRQNLVFSATMPREVRCLVDKILVDPAEVSTNYSAPLTSISHVFYRVDKQRKNVLLRSILKEEDVRTAIVFTRTKHKARSLARTLERQGFKATSIQGNLSQQRRQQALDGFKSGLYDVLVATDIAARGIDVSGISHVINYDMPGTTEAYTHRTGRTGRANQTGTALTFSTIEDDKMTENLRRTLRERFVCKENSASEVEDIVLETGNLQVQSPVPRRNSHRKERGKKSSQRNRMAAFDFGI